jgi:hypothetical protein
MDIKTSLDLIGFVLVGIFVVLLMGYMEKK